ncbi:hypothetical protein GBA52_029111 [Prunus armeniaca]|nr:hypothetical protein GBA52_029111 [Prunus armeniaca]
MTLSNRGINRRNSAGPKSLFCALREDHSSDSQVNLVEENNQVSCKLWLLNKMHCKSRMPYIKLKKESRGRQICGISNS